jgi:glycosyltransferase involved in cell wall biosynthesis
MYRGMIIIVHKHNKTTRCLNEHKKTVAGIAVGNLVAKTLKSIAESHPNDLIVWCHENYLEDLNVAVLPDIFHHKRIISSYNPSNDNFLPEQIGYIERSFFLKIKKDVTYPTWIMSSNVGGVYAAVINTLKTALNFKANFDYFLNSLAKRAMVEGLFCYSEPNLLVAHNGTAMVKSNTSTYTLFKFVKQHYKWVWVFFLFAAYAIFEKKLKVLPLVKSLCYRQLSVNFNLQDIPIRSTKEVITTKEVDVIIPTIGRKQYLYNVLKDLSNQTITPKNVIIVEQNPKADAVSELDYINTTQWPFIIKHIFTHKTGVCNARNLALAEVKSEWTLLGDDDNRFSNTLIEDLFYSLKQHGARVGTTVYLQPNETQTYLKTAQTSIFGAGNSIVKSNILKGVAFNMAYEFNYGEDNDFGMQLRQLGHDVIYFANIKITHLKAPIGGYRTKIVQLWASDDVQPKPSPTIQLLHCTYFTKQQQLGYKLLLGLRSYKNSTIKNPIHYISYFKKQWARSLYWCRQLQSK